MGLGAQVYETGALTNAHRRVTFALFPSRCRLLPGGKALLDLGPHSGGQWSPLGHLPIFSCGLNSWYASLGARSQPGSQAPSCLATMT